MHAIEEHDIWRATQRVLGQYLSERLSYLFLHYWGKGKAIDLGQSLKRVLDVQAVVKS